jgi:hypothetical protein
MQHFLVFFQIKNDHLSYSKSEKEKKINTNFTSHSQQRIKLKQLKVII